MLDNTFLVYKQNVKQIWKHFELEEGKDMVVEINVSNLKTFDYFEGISILFE